MNFTFLELLSFIKNEKSVEECLDNISDFTIRGFSSLNNNKDGTVTWLRPGNVPSWPDIKSKVIICDKNTTVPADAKCLVIKVDNPRLTFISLINHFNIDVKKSGIESTAIIGKDCKMGKNVYIGHYTVIGDDVTVGDNTIIHSHVVVNGKTSIGNNCLIHSGVNLGGEGLGFERNSENIPIRFPHIGGLLIGNNVEIRSQSCINKGTLDNTEIHDNVKISCLCHISHNVIIHENTLITSSCSIVGNAIIGKNCWLSPHSVIKNGIKVGDNALIGMGAVVIKDVEAGDTVAGVPAKSI